MKKRVAVFANGWSDNYLQEVTEGIVEAAEKKQYGCICVFKSLRIF